MWNCMWVPIIVYLIYIHINQLNARNKRQFRSTKKTLGFICFYSEDADGHFMVKFLWQFYNVCLVCCKCKGNHALLLAVAKCWFFGLAIWYFSLWICVSSRAAKPLSCICILQITVSLLEPGLSVPRRTLLIYHLGCEFSW